MDFFRRAWQLSVSYDHYPHTFLILTTQPQNRHILIKCRQLILAPLLQNSSDFEMCSLKWDNDVMLNNIFFLYI